MIHVISTAASLPEEFELRKEQYLEGLLAVQEHYKVNPYIIESIGCDYFEPCIQFIGQNNYTDNKGVNEFANIEEFFKQYGHLFNNEDDIVKTTLRYVVTSSHLIDIVQAESRDIYLKSSADIYGAGDFGVHTFLMSMKYKCWKEFFANHFDVKSPNPIEWAVAEYARVKNVTLIDRLDMIARPWNHRPRTYTV
jgi:hypothetical protein